MQEMEDWSDKSQKTSRSRPRMTHMTSSSHSEKLRGKSMLGVVVLTVLSMMSTVSGTITVISQQTNESVAEFSDAPASFVPDRVSYYGLRGYAVYAEPANACSKVQPTPSNFPSVNWILVAKRFDCDFQTKIENAQNMGYSAIIIHNVGSNRTEPMTVRDPERLVIYAAFIGEYNGHLLRDEYCVAKANFTYFLSIEDDFSFSGYVLPFAIVVTICFVVMIFFMVRVVWQQVCRWLRERRRSRRRKLPNSVLKKLPLTKWTKGDPYETCAVCLEDFVEQEKVRVLPCSHGFHDACITPWLTKNRRVCPICKRKVILAEERFNDSDSDSDDETTPLLRNPSTSNPNPATSTSTFVQQGDSLFRVRRHPLLHRARRPTSHGPNRQHDSSDSSSISSSNSQGTQSHHSLPVLAEVHGSSFDQSAEVPPGSRAPFPSLNPQPPPFPTARHREIGEDAALMASAHRAINLDPVDMEPVSASHLHESDIPNVHIPITGDASAPNRNQNAIV